MSTTYTYSEETEDKTKIIESSASYSQTHDVPTDINQEGTYTVESSSIKLTVRVQIEEEGGFSGQIEEYPGCISQGETLEELVENMNDAFSAYFDDNVNLSEYAFEYRMVGM